MDTGLRPAILVRLSSLWRVKCTSIIEKGPQCVLYREVSSIVSFIGSISIIGSSTVSLQLSEEEFKSRLVAEEAKLKALLPSDTCNIDDVTSMVDKEGERGGGGGRGRGRGRRRRRKEGEAEKAGEVAKQAAVVKYLRVSISEKL